MFKRIFLCAAFMLATSYAHADDCDLKPVATLDVVSSENGLLVPTVVEGRHGYFLLDLVGHLPEITDVTATALQLRRLPVSFKTLLIEYGHKVVKVARTSVQWGSVTMTLPLTVTSPPWQNDPNIMGRIGLTPLSLFDVELDLGHDKMRLFSPNHCKGQAVYWTRSAPVAAVPMTAEQPVRTGIGGGYFLIPMKLDGKEIQRGLITTDNHGRIGWHAAHDVFGADADATSIAFKTLELDGISISNPRFNIDPIDQKTGCPPSLVEPYNSEAGSRSQIKSCPKTPYVRLGIPELKKLRVFIQYQEHMLYATAADAN